MTEIRLDFARSLRWTAASVVAFVVAATAGLSYRLWSQLSGSVPDSAPAAWLYGAAGWLAGPFQHLETAEPVNKSGFLELAGLIALEVYLVAGLLLAGLCWLAADLLRAVGYPVVTFRIDRQKYNALVWRALTAARVGWTTADAFLGRQWLWALSYVQTRDWAAYRARAASALRASLAAGHKTWILARTGAAEAAARSPQVRIAVAGVARASVARLRRDYLRIRALAGEAPAAIKRLWQEPGDAAVAVSRFIATRARAYGSRWVAGANQDLERMRVIIEAKWAESLPKRRLLVSLLRHAAAAARVRATELGRLALSKASESWSRLRTLGDLPASSASSLDGARRLSRREFIRVDRAGTNKAA